MSWVKLKKLRREVESSGEPEIFKHFFEYRNPNKPKSWTVEFSKEFHPIPAHLSDFPITVPSKKKAGRVS